MSVGDRVHDRVTVLLAEYGELRTEINLRIDLQHRNLSVLLTLMAALTGFLIEYWNGHGLTAGRASLLHSDLALLIVIAPLLANIFVWRHVDHDLNIVDKAAYVESVLRPGLHRCVGGSVLEFETFLHGRRKTRPHRAGPLIWLGYDCVPMLAISILYLIAAWWVLLNVANYARGAHVVFDALLYVGTAATVASVIMVIITGREYASVGGGRRALTGRTRVTNWVRRRRGRSGQPPAPAEPQNHAQS